MRECRQLRSVVFTAGLTRVFMEREETRRFQFLKKDYSRGFIADCGFEAVIFERGRLESQLRVLNRHRQQDGYIHAGVIATMADHTAGYAAFTLVSDAYRILTIEFKINFLEPAYGDGLICRSRILREGGQILVGESEVFDRRSDGEVLVAKAIVTLRAVHQSKIIPAPPH
jgi:uncharacterized protein (TIGR00369 family)